LRWSSGEPVISLRPGLLGIELDDAIEIAEISEILPTSDPRNPLISSLNRL
jgi:hypothetical protein